MFALSIFLEHIYFGQLTTVQNSGPHVETVDEQARLPSTAEPYKALHVLPQVSSVALYSVIAPLFLL